MIVEKLRVSGVRNIGDIELDADPKINWISGPNGAGKTSLLEAIFLLARGRSFRGRKQGPVLGRGRRHLEVTGRVALRDGSAPPFTIRLRQSERERRLFENDGPLERLADLRNRLQVRVVASNAQQLLEGEPRIRRLFLDWNLFHVEQGYGRVLTEYRRVIAQRNAWLRSGAQGPPVWDEAYCRLSEAITFARLGFVQQLQEYLDHGPRIGAQIPPEYKIRYRRGWPEGRDLREALAAARLEDRARGFTYHGPARSDFCLSTPDGLQLPSRGQTKVLVFYLQLGAQRFSDRRHARKPVWLVDDLSAEIDTETESVILDEIRGTGSQIFATFVGNREQSSRRLDQAPGRVFHVERGGLEPPESV